MMKYFSSAIFVISLSAYIFFSDIYSSKMTSFLSYKNPYSRKPASFEIAVKEEVEVPKVTEVAKNLSKDKRIKKRIENLETLVKCYQQECEFSNNDPREYGLSVGQALKKEMMALYEEVLRGQILDKEIEKKAIELMTLEDGHVKEAAILLASTQPPTQEVLNSLIENVIDYHDPNLIGLTLIELEKYDDEKFKIQIRDSFLRNFKGGSLLVKEALAKGLYRFVTQESRDQFQDILNTLPRNSRIRNNLKASLDRFDHTTSL